MDPFLRKKYILMVKNRKAIILVQTVTLSFCLLAGLTMWLQRQVEQQNLRKQEYQYWLGRYQAVQYIRSCKEIKADKRLFVLPRVVVITKDYYIVKVTEMQSVRVPRKNNK